MLHQITSSATKPTLQLQIFHSYAKFNSVVRCEHLRTSNFHYCCCEQYVVVNRVINFALYVNFCHIVGLILENLY